MQNNQSSNHGESHWQSMSDLKDKGDSLVWPDAPDSVGAAAPHFQGNMTTNSPVAPASDDIRVRSRGSCTLIRLMGPDYSCIGR
jgi:hypothetical protein